MAGADSAKSGGQWYRHNSVQQEERDRKSHLIGT